MYYQQYYPVDVVNGPGTRATLFVSGCIHQCAGCYNQSTWRVDAGTVFDEAMLAQIITDLTDTRIVRRGLSLSGGDPLLPQNIPTVLKIINTVRHACPDKDIWLWTGYRLSELNRAQLAVVDKLDVLVDGKFERALASPDLVYRGSGNQVIYYLK